MSAPPIETLSARNNDPEEKKEKAGLGSLTVKGISLDHLSSSSTVLT